nr:ATP-grasp domain-containing protein [Nannocystis sp. SCPEA4]
MLLTQAPDPLPDDGDDIVASTRAALVAGFTALHLPPDADHRGDLLTPIAELAVRERREPAVWVGTIPEPATYRAVYAVLRDRGVDLVNDPDQHLGVMEFDRAYPRLADLTPRSVVVTELDQVEAAAATVGLPAFVKGAVLSRKHLGWRHCIATTLPELRERVAAVLRSPYHARGRAIVRTLAPLRHHRVAATDVPIAREYRVFLHRGEPLAHGYYWPYFHDFVALSPAEEAEVLGLARRAAARLDAPLLSLDIAQLESGAWIVIEPGDPQFSGLSFIAPRPLWRRLAERLALETCS